MGRIGQRKELSMKPKHDFQFVSKHSPEVRAAYDDLIQLLSLVHDDLKHKYKFEHKVVGSYERNMITHDLKSNVGFDLDVNITPHEDEQKYSAKDVKLSFKRSLDKFSEQFGFDPAEDSTRVLTIKVKDKKNSKILHGVDFAFINDYTDDDGYDCQEYIHFNKKQNSYEWQEQSEGFYLLPERFEWLLDNNYKDELDTMYLKMKNKNNDPDKHSRSIFAEAVSACYNLYYDE